MVIICIIACKILPTASLDGVILVWAEFHLGEGASKALQTGALLCLLN